MLLQRSWVWVLVSISGACNFSSIAFDALFWPLWATALKYTACTQTQRETERERERERKKHTHTHSF